MLQYMAENREIYSANLNPTCRLRLRQMEGRWVATITGRNVAPTIVADYATLDEAKNKAPEDAKPLLRQLQIPFDYNAVIWRRIVNRPDVLVEEVRELEHRRSRVLQVTAFTIGITFSILASYIAFTQSKSDKPETLYNRDMSRIIRNNLELQKRVDDLVEASKSTMDSSKQNQVIADIQAKVDTLKQEQSSFEIALGDDPGKRLAIPMLRKDMDILRDEHKNDMMALQAELGRVLDLMKWLLGLVGVGSLAGALSSLFGKTKPS